MWLTKNEKKVLKLLIDNAKLSDTSIANTLNISSQAIGRIRRKLEEEIIERYTLDLDLSKLGITSLSLIDAHYLEESEKEIRRNLPQCPKITNVFSLAHGTNRFRIVRLNSNLEECENCDLDSCKLLEISKIHTIPISNILKNDLKPLIHKAIDDLGTKSTKINFNILR